MLSKHTSGGVLYNGIGDATSVSVYEMREMSGSPGSSLLKMTSGNGHFLNLVLLPHARGASLSARPPRSSDSRGPGLRSVSRL